MVVGRGEMYVPPGPRCTVVFQLSSRMFDSANTHWPLLCAGHCSGAVISEQDRRGLCPPGTLGIWGSGHRSSKYIYNHVVARGLLEPECSEEVTGEQSLSSVQCTGPPFAVSQYFFFHPKKSLKYLILVFFSIFF